MKTFINFNEIEKNRNLDSYSKKEQINSLLEKNGIFGFFPKDILSPVPNGIVFDYNIEENKREMGV